MKIDIQNLSEENQVKLVKLIAWMEVCGSIGHTPKPVKVYIDGDGAARPVVRFETPREQSAYADIKKELLDDYQSTHDDLESISLE